MEIDSKVIQMTLRKRSESQRSLRMAAHLANLYDQLLYEKPVDTLTCMNVPEDEMYDILSWMVSNEAPY